MYYNPDDFGIYSYSNVINMLIYLPPILGIEEVVCAALVGRGLLDHGHTGRLRDPHLLLHVIPPVTIVSTIDITFAYFYS